MSDHLDSGPLTLACCGCSCRSSNHGHPHHHHPDEDDDDDDRSSHLPRIRPNLLLHPFHNKVILAFPTFILILINLDRYLFD